MENLQEQLPNHRLAATAEAGDALRGDVGRKLVSHIPGVFSGLTCFRKHAG